jgi:type II secretory pathway component PulF
VAKPTFLHLCTPQLAKMWADLADIQAQFVKQQALFAPHYTTMHIIAEQTQNLKLQCKALATVAKKKRPRRAPRRRRKKIAVRHGRV